jgi:hypothetical protein
MTEQVEMQLGGVMVEVAAVEKDLRWLESYLREKATWMTAAEILVLVDRNTDEGQRWLRKLAQVSDWVISGQKGYKHLSHATGAEVDRFVCWMESQGKKMIGRAERMRRNAHTVLG